MKTFARLSSPEWTQALRTAMLVGTLLLAMSVGSDARAFPDEEVKQNLHVVHQVGHGRHPGQHALRNLLELPDWLLGNTVESQLIDKLDMTTEIPVLTPPPALVGPKPTNLGDSSGASASSAEDALSDDSDTYPKYAILVEPLPNLDDVEVELPVLTPSPVFVPDPP